MPNLSPKDLSCIMNMIGSIKKIQDYSEKFKSADDFYNDSIWFDTTMMNFIVIGEMVEKLSEKFILETENGIDWFKVKGFWNIIAHNYFGIDAEEVWQIINGSLLSLKHSLEKLTE